MSEKVKVERRAHFEAEIEFDPLEELVCDDPIEDIHFALEHYLPSEEVLSYLEIEDSLTELSYGRLCHFGFTSVDHISGWDIENQSVNPEKRLYFSTLNGEKCVCNFSFYEEPEFIFWKKIKNSPPIA